MPLRTAVCIVNTQGEGPRWTRISYPMGLEKEKVAFNIIYTGINTAGFLCVSVLENHAAAPTPASGGSHSSAYVWRCYISWQYQINNPNFQEHTTYSILYHTSKNQQSQILTIQAIYQCLTFTSFPVKKYVIIKDFLNIQHSFCLPYFCQQYHHFQQSLGLQLGGYFLRFSLLPCAHYLARQQVLSLLQSAFYLHPFLPFPVALSSSSTWSFHTWAITVLF